MIIGLKIIFIKKAKIQIDNICLENGICFSQKSKNINQQ